MTDANVPVISPAAAAAGAGWGGGAAGGEAAGGEAAGGEAAVGAAARRGEPVSLRQTRGPVLLLRVMWRCS